MYIKRNHAGEAVEFGMTRPDDWHLHVRDGERLHAVLPHTVRRFRRAIIMPNLSPPVTTVKGAYAYYERIVRSIPSGSHFEPLMALYLTDNTSLEEIKLAKESRLVHAVKYYPAGATTNSDSGVTDIRKCYRVFEAMEKHGVALCLHGELLVKNGEEVDMYDREKEFIDNILYDLVKIFPELRVVFEHITTHDGVMFVTEAGPNIGATVTAHHLMVNRNALFQGNRLRPHNYFLPVAKREAHRRSLVRAVVSGNPKFFLGTDSAPHAKGEKECDCGCAGGFTAHAALELYAEAFENAGALEKLEAFASFHGPDFYGLPRNEDTIALVKDPWQSPQELSFGEDVVVVPFQAGSTVQWKIVPNS